MDIGKPDECERAGCDSEPVENISTGEPIEPTGWDEETPELDAPDPTYVCRNCEIEFAERLPMSVNEFINDEKTEEWDPI
jgi:hypothetical protein